MHKWGFPGGPVIKNPPANAEDMSLSSKEPACQSRRYKRCRFDPWVWKILWRRAWELAPYSCLENPMNRWAWRAAVHRVTQGWTRLKKHHTHAHTPGRFRTPGKAEPVHHNSRKPTCRQRPSTAKKKFKKNFKKMAWVEIWI